MRVGDKVVCKPQTFSVGEGNTKEFVKGEIVYVHPRMHYATVEFKMGNRVIRESFFREDLNIVKK